MSEIESQINAQVEDATHDSNGRFTIDRKHALQKLRTFLLPSPTFWILKVIQAAVASGAKQVVILQTPSTTKIRFRPAQNWTLAGLESALLDPEDGRDRAVNHLKRGLWSLTSQVDGFLLTPARPADSPSTLCWDGQALTCIARPVEENLVLTVQHANVDSQWCPGMLYQLRKRANTCPIPLSLNGIRIDGLQRDATHGNTGSSHPYQLSLLHLEGLPPLDIPAASYESAPESATICRLKVPAVRPRQASAACLLTLKKDAQSSPLQSFLHWVLDGVILTSQPLYAQGSNCWCSLYASAAELPLDLGGFQITDTSRTAALAYQIGCAFYSQLNQTKIDLGDYIGRSRTGKRRGALALGGLGACILWTGTAGLVIGLLACGAAAVSASRAKDAGNEERLFQTAFEKLLEQWPGSGVNEASNRWG